MKAAAPLRRKLSAIALITTGGALLVTTVLFLAGEVLAIRSASLRELRILNEAIASNSTAALAFENPDDARGVLAAFRADPHIVAAALYTADGRLFVSYPEPAAGGSIPVSPGAPGYAFRGQALIGVAPVRENERVLGTLYVRSDMSAIYDRLASYALVAALVIGLALLAAWIIARRLQRQLSAPILELAATAKRVSDAHDYRVRGTPVGINELDDLTHAFNHMLEQTQEHDRRMNAQLRRLALLQQITHSIGSRHDLNSIFQVLLRSLEEHMPIDFGAVCLRNSGGAEVLVESAGSASTELRTTLGLEIGASIPIGSNGLYRAINGALIHEPDTTQVASPFTQRFAKAELLSLVIAPLTVESNVFGVLVAARRASGAFSSAECEFLKQLSEHVALASQQAQLYGALQQTYEDLRRSQQSALQTERLRALGEMASGIAHDINNAISPVSLYSELLQESEPQLSEAGRNRLATIRRAIEDVAGTIERMREFYRPREEAREFARLDFKESIEHVLELTEPRWRALPQSRGIVIELRQELAAHLPEVMGDAVELRDALTNLVFNAVDAMPEGGTLTLRTQEIDLDGKPAVQVEVSDTGSGMDEETRRRCIEPFFTTKGQRGTGLGLASVYGMLQRHDATLEIDSAPGRGTTMRMIFPTSGDIAEATGSFAVARTMRRLRILVIDDDPILIRSVTDVLEAEGHAVEAANGGQAGIDAFAASHGKGQPFTLVITDLGMPRVDGRRVAAAIKGLSPATPVILLTGWGQRLLDEKDIPPNVDRVLSKPPRLAQLRAALEQLTA
ncbi:MAG TPA: ATP-binding protein [Steroidobacteraceae bacterium]|jgi:signal transduction histidine kinase/CheY-like chemotaxis protein|nr:ATP-binding protein [Steroidobacteraceae bacterium]